MRKQLMFNNNEGVGSFNPGGYDRNAIFPEEQCWTRLSRFLLPDTNHIRWKCVIKHVNFNGSFHSMAADQDENLYLAIRDDNEAKYSHVYRISKDGIATEIFTIEGKLNTSCTFHQEGFLLVFEINGSYSDKITYDHVYALEKDGTKLWEYTLQGQIVSRPVIDRSGRIYFSTFEAFSSYMHTERTSRLYCLSPKGELLWKKEGEYVFSNGLVLASDDSIYITDNTTRSLLKLDLNGNRIWSVYVGHQSPCPLILGNDGTVYIVAYREEIKASLLYAISKNGELLWTHAARSSPALFKNGDLVFADTCRLLCTNNRGVEKWCVNTETISHYPPIIDQSERILFTSYLSEDFIEVYSNKGEKIWDYSDNVKRNNCFVLGKDSTLYAATSKRARPTSARFNVEVIAFGS